MAMSQFPLRQSLADGVHDILIERFMDGTFEPGQPLNIDALARELRVSQTPIREALARLEHTGLVAREALKGYRVAALFTEAELVSLMDARLVLEPVLAAAAALHVDEERISRLDETVQTLRQHAEHPDSAGLGRYWAADELFHSLIAEYAGNPFLERAYRSLGGQVQRFRFFAELGSSDAGFAATEHAAVIAALREGDAAAANAAMRAHVEGAKGRALRDRHAVER